MDLGSNLQLQSQCDLECKGVNENTFNLKGNFFEQLFWKIYFFQLYCIIINLLSPKSLVQEETDVQNQILWERHFRNSIRNTKKKKKSSIRCNCVQYFSFSSCILDIFPYQYTKNFLVLKKKKSSCTVQPLNECLRIDR